MIRFALILMFAVAAASELDASFDCLGQRCPEIRIAGTTAATLPGGERSPFGGFADASVRRDPETGRLWMAYAWPSLQVDRAGSRAALHPQVDIHLAASDDGGTSWRFISSLWPARPARSPNRSAGRWSYEVPNLLPIVTRDGVLWYGARLEYFLPDDGGFSTRPPGSFRILISRASSAQALAEAPATRLGSIATGPEWGIDFNLARLSDKTTHCGLWNEPALFHDGHELFLALSCMAFHRRTPDLERSDLMLFATPAAGDPASWKWRFAGVLASAVEARELGGEKLTQIVITRGRDGSLLAIVTPDTWSAGAGDFVHHGCRAVALEPTGSSWRFRRRANGELDVRATVIASDAGPEGTAACTYDPASSTGIILTKRKKPGASLNRAKGLTATLHRTGLHP